MTSNASVNTFTTSDQLTLRIKCKRPQPGLVGRFNIESRPCSEVHIAKRTCKYLAIPQWRCTIGRNSLQPHKVFIKLEVLSFVDHYVIPGFGFIHCIPHGAERIADVQVFHILELGIKKLVHSGMDCSCKHTHTTGCSLHLRSRLFSNFTPACPFIVVSVKEDPIIDKNDPDRYAFDLVLSTSIEPPAAFVTTATIVSENKPSPSSKSFKDMFPDMYQDILRLLKDPESVSVAFVFFIHSCQRKVGLWAHRTLLDKYPCFQALFGADKKVSVPIQGISLTTFCVLLKYLYTKELDLAVDPTQYLMCDMDHLRDETSVDLASALAVLNKTLGERNAAKFYAIWNIRDKVTWLDLLLAADRFEIADLRKHCLEGLLMTVDKNNALELLFEVGPRFKEEIRDPIVKYISEHLDNVFSIQTQDPFKRFADHEGYHELMLELLRRK
ncbi:hypothetical protein BGZ65_006092 [Modicella reniformis]|uniref:BTB domain-containing protein n=1 Tax=Modicella reniformis TaxID=1440133 RepID=A0A9P6LTW0_9FUNG|nr:hypothetical protein BGZ65_006092 [Modicella reniformis]